MKNTKTWVKVLLLAFCLVFVFSSLIACGTDEKLADLQNQLDDLKNKTDSTATDLDTDKAAKDAAIAELKTALAAVKTTADAAATAAALEAVAADLAADKADLAAAVTELKEALATKAATEAVETKIAAVEALIKANGEADAEKAEELEAAIAALTKTVNDNKTAIDATIATEVAKLNEAIKGATGDATKAIETLTATVAENKKAADKAVEDLTSEMNKKVEKIEAAIADTNKALEGKADAKALEELQKTVEEGVAAEVKTLTETIATKADKDAVDAAVASATEAIGALGTKVTALETKVDTMKAAIEAEIETLKGAVSALETKVEALANAEEINAAIEELADRVTTLENAMSAEDLADAYEYATQALNGAEKINFTNEKYGEVKDFDGSLNAFDKMFNDINSNLYSEAEYASFKAAYENIKFFLNRALNVEAIYDYFMQMKDLVDSLPTLVESLEAEIVAIETGKLVTLDAKCIEKLVAIYTQIGTVNAAETDESKKIVVGENLETRYTTIVDAKANLDAAEAASEAVEKAIADVVVNSEYGLMYKESDNSLRAADQAFRAFSKAWFSTEAYNALYSAECNEAKDLVANYETYYGYYVRYTELYNAVNSKPELPNYVTNFNENKPMWYDLNAENGLVVLLETLDAWKAEYNIDEVNFALIYPEYENIAKANAYAIYMNDVVYVGMNVEVLINKVTELCAKPQVLFADAETVATYRAEIDAVLAAIEACENYTVNSDNNYAKMLPADMLKKFADVETVMNNLIIAANLIEGYIEQMEAVKGKVDFGHFEQIKLWELAIIGACKDAEIALDAADPNYTTVRAAEALALNAELVAEYNELTAKIAEVYKKIEEKFGNGTWELKDGKYVVEVTDYFADLINEYGIDRIDINLTLNYADGSSVEGNLKTIYFQWNEIVTDYYDFADKAVAAAVAVNEAIARIADLATNNLNNYAAIEAAWNLFVEWTDEYLMTVKDATYEQIAAAYAEIADITAIGGVNAGKVYAFVTGANAKTIYDSYTAIVAHKAAAAEAWTTVFAALSDLTDWNIHSDFVTPNKAYSDYLATYYAGAITTANEGKGMNDELAAKDAFDAAETDYEAAYGEAKLLAEKIKAAIATLDGISSYADLEKAIAAIYADVELFNNTYKCSAETTDVLACRAEEWSVTDAEVLTLEKNVTRAAYERVCDEFITKNGLTKETIVTTAQIANVINNAKNTLDKAENASKLENIIKVVEGQLEGYQEMIDTYAECVEVYEEFVANYEEALEADETFAAAVKAAFEAAAKDSSSPRSEVRDSAVKTFVKALEDAASAYEATLQ